jgi:hypothetical protein
MQEQGFYKPHIKVRYNSKRERVFDGSVKVKVSIAVEMDVCVTPPTKIDFVNALFFISGPCNKDKDDFDVAINNEGATRRWMQMIANQIVKPCRHPNCEVSQRKDFRLVQKCYQPCPEVVLDVSVPQQTYFQTDSYDIADCCKLNGEKLLHGDITCYGYSVVKDILKFEADLSESTDLQVKLLRAEKMWRRAFIDEMRLLIGIEFMPQERKNLDPYYDTFISSA